ncbi:putative arsenite efflux transporter [Moniliophthora roreri]|nr:putative arsenite efflux transporter [Moniliophthora roreri]
MPTSESCPIVNPSIHYHLLSFLLLSGFGQFAVNKTGKAGKWTMDSSRTL